MRELGDGPGRARRAGVAPAKPRGNAPREAAEMTEPDSETTAPRGAPTRLDAIVIGAGFGGMYCVHRLRGMGLTVLGIEAGGDVGGVWYWNRYPGARCDVFSIDYSYSFSDEIQQEWTWSEEYSAQPEILRYANFVADKLSLRKDFRFNTRVLSASFDDERSIWIITTDGGEVFEATFCVMATGPLSIPKDIDIPGVQAFNGTIYRAAKWPHTPINFGGQRVGVVGTGSSGMQIVPIVAEQADALYVFQRTPSFTFPMRNKPIAEDYARQVKAHYPALRASARNNLTGGNRPMSTRPLFSVSVAEREELLEDGWRRGGRVLMGLFSDALFNPEANEIIAEFVRGKIKETVNDPDTAERLTPRGYPIFSRRPCLDTNYYETYNRPNVRLVDCLTDPIESIGERSVKTRNQEIELDTLIFATGYDGLTGAMLAIDVRGRGGQSLKDKWRDGARSYLGLVVEGFPNLFMVCGANGPSALANIVILNEENGDWIANCIEHMRKHGYSSVEAKLDDEDRWVQTVSDLADKSLIPKAATWYVGTNIPGKPRVFPIYTGGLNRYREVCNQVADDNYRGLAFV
jgi:cation diffusion facilitator CzcD-associated flavoprotein CzcO